MDLTRRVEKFMRREGLLDPGRPLLVAVSGGVDSMVLAEVLTRLAPSLGLRLGIANFNHQLRPEAAEEAAFVGKWAAAHAWPYFSGSADIKHLSQGRNLQDTARRERYAFLRRSGAELGNALIATAHHSDDQAETVLLHLLRGSGAAGLRGMLPREQDLIRPLLAVSRAEIIDFARANGIEYREDASNSSNKYLRNRIRRELMPELARYNPRVAVALNATARICRDEDALLSGLARQAFCQLWQEERSALAGAGLDQLDPALRRRVVRLAFAALAGERPELSFAQVEAVLELGEEQQTALPGGLVAYRRQDLFFAARQPPLTECRQSYPLLLDGQWRQLPALGAAYCAQVVDAPPPPAPNSFCAPASALAGAVWRGRRPGDSLPSAGKAGRVKLKDIFIAARIPRSRRNTWPLLAQDERLLWAPGLREGKMPLIESSFLIENSSIFEEKMWILIKAKIYDMI